jgi:hypothetical protein
MSYSKTIDIEEKIEMSHHHMKQKSENMAENHDCCEDMEEEHNCKEHLECNGDCDNSCEHSCHNINPIIITQYLKSNNKKDSIKINLKKLFFKNNFLKNIYKPPIA